MVHRAFYLGVALALVTGCGQSFPPSPEQLVNRGHFDDAIEVCTQSIRANPRDAEAYLYRGRAYHCRNRDGDLQRAIADFTDSISIAPEEPEAYYSRALAYRDLGDPQKSAADEKSARQFDSRLKDIFVEAPDVSLPSAIAKAKADKASGDKPGDDDEARSEVGGGTRSQAERRRDRQKASSAVGSAQIDPFDGGVPAAKTKGTLLDSLRMPRRSVAPLDDELLADDEWLDSGGAPLGKADAGARPNSEDRPRSEAGRYDARSSELSSPWASRRPSAVLPDPQASGRSPSKRSVQSPFPQRLPRPTGFVDEQPLGPTQAQPRKNYNSPYSVPTVRPPGAYHDDFNP